MAQDLPTESKRSDDDVDCLKIGAVRVREIFMQKNKKHVFGPDMFLVDGEFNGWGQPPLPRRPWKFGGLIFFLRGESQSGP